MQLKERFERLYGSFSLRRQHATAATDDLAPLPTSFRNRVLLFWRDLIAGTPAMTANFGHDQYLQSFWSEMHNDLQHLYGLPYLRNPRASDVVDGDLIPFLNTCETDQFFDFMERAFQLPISSRLEDRATEVVGALNEMFRVEDLPYAMTNLITHEESVFHAPEFFDLQHTQTARPLGGFDGPEFFDLSEHDAPMDTGVTRVVVDEYPRVIRVDEQVPHREAIQPALTALSAPHFKEANDEFLKALVRYRDDELPDCLTACNSALESVLKVICDRRKWAYEDHQTLKPLLDAVVAQTSLDPFYKSALVVVGTVRSRLGSAHGRGTKDRPVPRHIAQYALTSTAAAIILLITETETDR